MLNNIVALFDSGAGGGGGSFESIATVTAAGGETSITFSSIPSTYKHLQIRGIARTTDTFSGADEVYLYLNGDTGTNYAYHYLRGTGSSALASGGGSTNSNDISSGNVGGSTTANVFGVSIIDIHDYASTSKTKTIRAFGGADTNSTTGRVSLASMLWNNTAAVTSLTIKLIGFSVGAPMAAGSTFALYGIKGA